ncbi:SDR family NAD(P)-dependent oxidoreductase [Anaerotignum sp.]|uniref:SDR family NAD(P)-dependent oxidoreductase n=1 Tax=Anaerotignum sp. TaxID=2039241 RepID=UPI0028ADDC1D|nr:SDR family oxidoreductase [Anaerotignum sp.]
MKALITGASGGIGRDMALILSRMGYDLILVSRDVSKMEQVKKHLKTDVQIISADLSVERDCFELYEAVKEQDIDILVNNAGFGAFGRFWEIPLEKELNMLDLNVRAVHILTKLFLSDFRKKDRGYILNVSSSAGFLAGPLMATYYATKNYVLRLTEAIYEELRKDGSHVHICALCPGPVNTGFNDRAGVRFALKGMRSFDVAKYAIDGMFAKRVVMIPGVAMKVAHVGEKFMGEKALLKVAYFFQHKKEG